MTLENLLQRERYYFLLKPCPKHCRCVVHFWKVFFSFGCIIIKQSSIRNNSFFFMLASTHVLAQGFCKSNKVWKTSKRSLQSLISYKAVNIFNLVDIFRRFYRRCVILDAPPSHERGINLISFIFL